MTDARDMPAEKIGKKSRLQLVEADLFYDGNPSFELSWDGFEIPIVLNNPSLKCFNVKTYHTFNKNRSTDAVTRPVNEFLATLPVEDQAEIASAMVMANAILKQQANTTVEVYDLLEECGNILADLDASIDLAPKIEAWVKRSIDAGTLPMADMSEAGSRPQDRADMTFYQAEAEVITGITVLFKLFSPLTGEFIYRHSAAINGQFKESLACSMYTKIIKHRYLQITQKLTYYISRLVSNKSHTQTDVAQHYKGITENWTARVVMDMVLVKKSASIDLYKSDGSVIKYIASCVKSFVESQTKNGSVNWNVKVFNDPKDGDILMSNEETNSSRIEVESTPSRKPAIVQPLADFAALWLAEKYIKEDRIDKQMYFEALDYYNEFPMLITPISQALLGNYFGPDLAGGKAIYLIDGEPMVRLCTLMQCLLVKSKAKYLPHALTLTIGTNERVGSLNDFTLTNAWKASQEYTELRKTVTPGYGDVTWDAPLKKINGLLTAKPLIYHTAPSIWDGIREENQLTKETYPDLDGKIFESHLDLLLETTSLFTAIWKERKLAEVA